MANGELSPSDAYSRLEAASVVSRSEGGGEGNGEAETAASGLAAASAKRLRYRSLFGNIGKLITFSRRRQDQTTAAAAAAAAAEAASHNAATDLLGEAGPPLPTPDTVSLDLIVPDQEASTKGDTEEDPVTEQLPELGVLETLESSSVAKETDTQLARSPCEGEPESEEIKHALVEESQGEIALGEKPEASPGREKKKMEYDMSLGGISTILEETEEAVKAQEVGGLLSEADLIKLESEIDLADFDSQKAAPLSETKVLLQLKRVSEAGEEYVQLKPRESGADCTGAHKTEEKEDVEGKTGRVAVLQNQVSESDSGYGYSTSESPVETEVDKPEKPPPPPPLPEVPPAEEIEGVSGGGEVFHKELEDTQAGSEVKLEGRAEALVSPSDKELAAFENAEVCLEDSMVDLGDISVKMDSLMESNSPKTNAAPKPDFGRASESMEEEEEDEDMEPVELDLSSNQSVRRRQMMEAKARRQRELEAARRQQEEALAAGAALGGEGDDGDRRGSEATAQADEELVSDKDIVDRLGPRRHSHENNACSAEGACAEGGGGGGGGRSRMRSRLPVRRSASCPRRAVEDYSTYIRSGATAKKPISHLIESSYSPVKIDFKPLSRVGQEGQGEQQLTVKQGEQAGKRRGKKVHFNSPSVDQVVTYEAENAVPGVVSESDEMRQHDHSEDAAGPKLPTVKARQGAGSGGGGGAGGVIVGSSSRAGKNKAVAEAEKAAAAAAAAAAQHEEKYENGNSSTSQETTVAKSPIYNSAKSWVKVSLDNGATSAKDRSAIKSISVKQTLASRKRLEKLHEDSVRQLGLQDESQYMTPLQRKDLEVRELKRQLDEAYFVVEQRELELDVFHHERSKSIEDAVKDRNERIAGLQVQIRQLESDFACLRAQHSEICKREKGLADSLEQLKAECAEKERRHQDLYLEMYLKGRDSARFERQDEIEKLAVLEPDKVAMEELLEKLEITQHDLQKWQSIKLKEAYDESGKAATEADAKLRFLRDSMFHYLTEKDREQNQQHLMAMIGIFSFTDTQMKHIMKSLDERRRKGKI